MRTLLIFSLTLCGCASSPTPSLVFREATEAFADGSIEKATAHFSHRLKDLRRLQDLKCYYADDTRRNGVRYLLEDHQFTLTSQSAERAVGEVIWRNGRREPVYFVLEEGVWKLDLPPTQPQAVPSSHYESLEQANAGPPVNAPQTESPELESPLQDEAKPED